MRSFDSRGFAESSCLVANAQQQSWFVVICSQNYAAAAIWN